MGSPHHHGAGAVSGAGGAVTYAKFDPALLGAGLTLSNGDLTVTSDQAVWRSVFLDIQPVSGKWAVEFTVDAQDLSSPFRLAQMGLSRTGAASTNMGAAGQQTSLYIPYTGDWYKGATLQTADYWDTDLSAATFLMLIDADNRYIGFKKSASMLLTTSEPAGTDGSNYVGCSLYDGFAGTFSITANTGQSAFVNDSDVPAGYNKGLWV